MYYNLYYCYKCLKYSQTSNYCTFCYMTPLITTNVKLLSDYSDSEIEQEYLKRQNKTLLRVEKIKSELTKLHIELAALEKLSKKDIS